MIDRSHPMVSSDKKLANAVGGKTARACDNCIRKRARWYCAADDAFLCQSCDASVHSANPLARRHERVRLKVVASLKLISSLDDKPAVPPPWHQGFTKKPRTPRCGKLHASRHTPKSEESSMITFNPLHLVPEMGSDETTPVTSCHEEQLLYQVPVFDPFAAELCLSNEVAMPVKVTTPVVQPKARMVDHLNNNNNNNNNNNINNNSSSLNGGLIILPSDVELAEFAADVESLLGKGLDEESFAMEGLGLGLGLGLLDCPQKDYSVDRSVKVEEDDHDQLMQQQQKQSDHHHHHHHQLMMDRTCEMEMMRDEPFQLSFDYDDSPLWEEKEDKVPVGSGDYMQHIMKAVDHDHHVNINDDTNYAHNNVNYDDENKKISKRILLKLDYEGIIAAWDEQRSPWTTGDRPELDPDDCNWPQCMGGIMHYNHPCGDMVMMTGNPAILDGGREARVSRYREKRRTRLFSKKIRYEVRKLNAEKRPRMKGRFVKRAAFSGFPLLSK